MYPKKVPKCEQPDKSWYTVHHCHDTAEPIDWLNRKDYYDVASLDPGRRNFALRIERRNLITGKITALGYEKIDLIGKGQEDIVVHIDEFYKRVNIFLDKYLGLIKACHVVIIERQLHINYKMVRFSQHLITYLTIHLRNNANLTVILEISNKLKTYALQAPKGLSDKEVKKWAVVTADELLRLRGDEPSLKVISLAKKKKDDLSDTVVQIEAVFSHVNLPTTQEMITESRLDLSKIMPMLTPQAPPVSAVPSVPAVSLVPGYVPLVHIPKQTLNINLSGILKS